jgi:YYY domain-containing protein
LAGLGPFVLWAFLHLQRGGASADVSGRLAHVLPLALMIGIAVYGTMWFAREGRASRGMTFALLLAAFGLLLIMGPELLYVDDAFGGSLERMNTVFKLYYQAWILLAAAAGFAVYYGISLIERTTGWKRLVGGAWAGVFVALALVAGYYPVAAAATKGEPFRGEATLDGLSYLKRFAPNEYRAIEFLRQNAGRDSTILEAVGNDYTPHGRISSSTGIPTVMGWAGHESQWRGSLDRFASREGDVRTIYSTDSLEEARELLAAYGVEYVYVGAREREKYGSDGIAKFSSFMETVFSEGGVTIYRRGQ